MLERVPVVAIAGVAGVGKTTLALALLDRLAAGGRPTAVARVEEGGGVGAALDALGAAVGSGVARSSPLEQRAAAVAAAMDACGTAALLDDAHRLADADALRLLRAMRLHLGRGRLLVTARRGFLLPPEELLDYGHVDLAGLRREPALAWMRELLDRGGGSCAGTGELEALHARLGGHPLLIKLSLGMRVTGHALPAADSIGFVEREMLAGLSREARAVLERLACGRMPLPPAALCDAAGGETPLAAALDDLRRRRLVEIDEHGGASIHDLVREHVLAAATAAAQARHHAACADFLRAAREAPGADPVARTDAVVHHLLLAGRVAEAAGLADAAADGAWASAHFEELSGWAQAIRGAGHELPVSLALCVSAALAREWRMDEARATLEDAERRAASGEKTLCLLARTRFHSASGEWSEVIAAHRALEAMPGISGTMVAKSAMNCVQAQLRIGLYRDAIATLGTMRGAGFAEYEHGIHTLFGTACLHLGRYRFARRAFDRGEAVSLRQGRAIWLFIARLQRALMTLFIDGPVAATAETAGVRAALVRPLESDSVDLELLEALVDAASGRTAAALRRLDALVAGMEGRQVSGDSVAMMLEARSGIRRDLGDLAGAEQDLRRCHAHARAVRMAPWRLQALLGLGHLAALRGRHLRARRLLEAVVRRFAAAGARREEMRAQGALSDLAVSEGRIAEAEGCARRSLELARAIGSRQAEARAARRMAECALADGRVAAAEEAAARARQLSAEAGDRRGEAGAAAVRVRALLAAGRPAEAVEDAAALAALAGACGHPALADEGRALEAVALVAAGRGEAAVRAARALREAPTAWVRALATRIGRGPGRGAAAGAGAEAALDPPGAARLRETIALLDGPRDLCEVLAPDGRFLVGDGEVSRFAPAGVDLHLDARTGVAFVRGRRLDLAARPVVRDLLAFFLERRPGMAADLDTIYRAVWRGSYEPLRHERRVYVTLRRLGALLGGDDLLVQPSKGEWCLRDGLRSTLVRRPRRRLPETLNARQAVLLRGLGADEPVTNASYRQRFKVHRFTATRDLAELVSLGLLLPAGTGRAIRYFLP